MKRVEEWRGAACGGSLFWSCRHSPVSYNVRARGFEPPPPKGPGPKPGTSAIPPRPRAINRSFPRRTTRGCTAQTLHGSVALLSCTARGGFGTGESAGWHRNGRVRRPPGHGKGGGDASLRGMAPKDPSYATARTRPGSTVSDPRNEVGPAGSTGLATPPGSTPPRSTWSRLPCRSHQDPREQAPPHMARPCATARSRTWRRPTCSRGC